MEAVIRDSSEHAEIENPRINTLTKFWRTGLIYYKPNTQIQFTFNSLDLPAWVIEELSKASERPKYTNPGEPWGAYNLKRSMGLAENKSKGKRINISAWSVETCFGYWVPSKYVGLVESRIDGASENKMADLMAFRDKLNQNSNDQLVARFREYLKDVDKIVGRVYKSFKWTKGDRIVIDFGDKEYYIGTVTSKRNGKIFVTFDDDSKDSFPIKSKAIAGKGVKKRKKSTILEQYLAKWVTHEFWRPSENLPEKFQDFVNRLRSRLHNDSQLERARKPLISANMPEIWSDVVASEDFSTSFFEYVSYKLNSPGSRPLIVKSLDSQVDFVKSASAKDVRDKFEEFLKNNNWEDDYWLEK